MLKLILLSSLFFIVSRESSHAPLEVATEVPVIYEAPKKRESILFVGDIMLGRYVERLSEEWGSAYPFAHMRETLFDSTYVIGNLEGPIPESHTKTPSNGFSFSFKKEVAQTLSENHITSLSLANNHTSDKGEIGHITTATELMKNTIAPFGHANYFNKTSVTNTVDDERITTLGINLITPFFKEKETLENVAEFCKDKDKEYTIAFIHAGNEYESKQSGYQVTFFHKLLDTTCVDAIIGSHPHVVQGIEIYNGKFIAYSLGNFIFDQYFSKETEEGLIIKLEKEEDAFLFTLIPIISRISQPKVAEGERRAEILSRIASSSAETLREDILSGRIIVQKNKQRKD